MTKPKKSAPLPEAPAAGSKQSAARKPAASPSPDFSGESGPKTAVKSLLIPQTPIPKSELPESLKVPKPPSGRFRKFTLSPQPASAPPASAPVVTAIPGVAARVLIAHSDPALLHLIRESLETFLDCEVRTTSSGLAAFDRTLEEPYRLLLLDLHLPDLAGELLYDLITRTYPRVHPGSLTAPAVMWLGLAADHPRQDELTREARTKALLLTPLNIQRLIDTAANLLPQRSVPKV